MQPHSVAHPATDNVSSLEPNNPGPTAAAPAGSAETAASPAALQPHTSHPAADSFSSPEPHQPAPPAADPSVPPATSAAANSAAAPESWAAVQFSSARATGLAARSQQDAAPAGVLHPLASHASMIRGPAHAAQNGMPSPEGLMKLLQSSVRPSVSSAGRPMLMLCSSHAGTCAPAAAVLGLSLMGQACHALCAGWQTLP